VSEPLQPAGATPAAQPGQPGRERSVAELLADITSDLSTLVRQEVELAKAEVRQEARAAGRAAGTGAGAAFAGWMVAVFGSLALVFALAGLDALGLALSALIVTVLWAVALAVLGLKARQLAAQVGPPRHTLDFLKEDAQWARTQR
jgi:hypothetical protein